jgi:hypothetical protein
MTAPMPSGFPTDYRDASYQPKIDPAILEEVRGAPQSLIDKLRHKARRDRYFLSKGVLGYTDVNPFTHGPLCRAIESREKKRRMFLMPRGHLKTTLCTITDAVAEGLTDPEECRMLILNEIEGNAEGFLSEIKAHFQTNELLALLFPELIPKRFGGPGSMWSSGRACLPRNTAYKEWTWTAAGVGRALAGNHFNRIKCDDLIGFEASRSPAAMRYAVAFAKAMEPLLINMDEDLIDFVGTRWGLQDLYREMLKTYGEDMAYFAREDIEDGQPIFPAKFSLKKLERLSVIDPVLYYAQYKNNPIADGVKDFNIDKVQPFDIDRNGNIVYRDFEGRLQRWTRDQLDIVMACDPNSGELTAPDFPGIIVAALSPREQVFVLESWSKRVQPDKFVDRIFEMWQHWQPRVLGIEKAGQQTTAFYFKKKTKELKVYINQQDLRPGNRNKAERIRKAVQPIINTERLYMRKYQSILQHQIRFHPDIENDDELDCLAYTTELFRAPLTSREAHEEEEAAERILSARNPVTGYGR